MVRYRLQPGSSRRLPERRSTMQYGKTCGSPIAILPVFSFQMGGPAKSGSGDQDAQQKAALQVRFELFVRTDPCYKKNKTVL